MSAQKKVLKAVMIAVAVFVGFTTVAFAAYYVYEHREELPIIKNFFENEEEIPVNAEDEEENIEEEEAEIEPIDPDSIEWSEYYNVDKMFRFKHPRDWYFYEGGLNPPPPHNTFVANLPEDEQGAYTYYASFNVYAMGDPVGQTLDDHGEIVLLQEDGYTKKEMAISGLRAVRLQRRSHPSDTGASVYCIYNGELYRIVFGGTSVAQFEENELILETMLDSFYFVDEAGNPVEATSDADEEFWSGNIYEGPVESGDTAELQQQVDTGMFPWRLDPVLVTRERAPEFGFDSGDEFSLIRQYFSETYQKNVAEVEAVHMESGTAYTFSLRQPETQGSLGIWVIYWIAESE